MKKQIMLLAIPALVFSSFVSIKKMDNITTTTNQNSKSKIVYLFFKAEKTKNGEMTIRLEDQKLSEGKLKGNQEFNEKLLKKGDLVVTLTNATGKTILKQSIENPLHPVLESYDGEIKRTQLSLETGEFSIRYPYSENIQTVQIDQVSNLGKKKVFTQKLKP